MSEVISIKSEKYEQKTYINLAGEVDVYSAPNFKKNLYDIIDSQDLDVIIDCSDLNYIDSTGLGILVGALKRVKQYNRDVYIRKLKGNMKKLFLITGLDKVFILEDSDE